jgi:hypothetical protein
VLDWPNVYLNKGWRSLPREKSFQEKFKQIGMTSGVTEGTVLRSDRHGA